MFGYSCSQPEAIRNFLVDGCSVVICTFLEQKELQVESQLVINVSKTADTFILHLPAHYCQDKAFFRLHKKYWHIWSKPPLLTTFSNVIEILQAIEYGLFSIFTHSGHGSILVTSKFSNLLGKHHIKVFTNYSDMRCGDI
jgi:hypothetical protein